MSRSLIGRGWRFPVSVDPNTGKIAMVEEQDDIRESVKLILSTSLGERVMHVDFGFGINDFAFETMDAGTASLIEYRVKEALGQWEKRIRNINVRSEMAPDDSGVLLVYVDYTVGAADIKDKLVYPFYLNDGGAG
ncbi:MAG: GPW/gp25 family protein [Clostridia bacterium]|nr:GPW/gp25 family protein [Clostridia bacterium]